MKLLIFAIILAISLGGIAIWWGGAISDDCDRLLLWLEGEHNAEEILERWKHLSEAAAFVTPYDLIRSAASNAEHYAALVAANGDPVDIEAARQVYLSSIRDIRRIHTLSWELVF